MDKETLRQMLTPQMVLRIAATLIREQQESGTQQPTAQPTAQPSPPGPATSATAATYGPGVSEQPAAQPSPPDPFAAGVNLAATYGPGVSGPDGSIAYGANGETSAAPNDRIAKLERELAEIKGQMSKLIDLLQGGAS